MPPPSGRDAPNSTMTNATSAHSRPAAIQASSEAGPAICAAYMAEKHQLEPTMLEKPIAVRPQNEVLAQLPFLHDEIADLRPALGLALWSPALRYGLPSLPGLSITSSIVLGRPHRHRCDNFPTSGRTLLTVNMR